MNAIGRRAWRESVARLSTTIECKACGEAWPSGDPALKVACPRCAARPGQACIWWGPHGATAHIARDVAAMQAGQLSICAALTWDGRHSRHVAFTCAPAPLMPAQPASSDITAG